MASIREAIHVAHSKHITYIVKTRARPALHEQAGAWGGGALTVTRPIVPAAAPEKLYLFLHCGNSMLQV